MSINVVHAITFGVLMIGYAVFGESSISRPPVGAIRWDAWTGGNVTEEVERTLGPEKYHNRLPWFAEVVNEKTVKIDGGRQEIMDREIDFAATAGLDYWAFLVYEEDNTMSVALKQYLQSQKRKQVQRKFHPTWGVPYHL